MCWSTNSRFSNPTLIKTDKRKEPGKCTVRYAGCIAGGTVPLDFLWMHKQRLAYRYH